ncbi:hypothetical protein EIP86_009223 [Pleurotus ostreatoroseus]|nr:hypothetical protein EIP86_009223 [Pleurotus ostreatoroseus]
MSPTHRRSAYRDSQQTTPSSSCLDSSFSEVLSASHFYSPCARRRASAETWIGKGAKGIYEWTCQIEPGPPPHTAFDPAADGDVHGAPAERDPLRPAALESPSARHTRRPAPPSLFVTPHARKTHPAPPVPSRPILAPAPQAVPALTPSASASASLSSIATPAFLASPASRGPSKPVSEAGEDESSPRGQRPTLFARISGHVRSWACHADPAECSQPTLCTPSHAHTHIHAHARSPPHAKAEAYAYTYTHTSSGGTLRAAPRVDSLDSDLLATLEGADEDARSSGSYGHVVYGRPYYQVDGLGSFDSFEEKEETRPPLPTPPREWDDEHPAFRARGRRAARGAC